MVQIPPSDQEVSEGQTTRGHRGEWDAYELREDLRQRDNELAKSDIKSGEVPQLALLISVLKGS